MYEGPSGRLTCPAAEYTLGEVWWRGFRAAHIVDVTAHQELTVCELPALADVSVWATIGYSWRVIDPLRVVAEHVWDAPALCRRLLAAGLSEASRLVPPADLVNWVPDASRQGFQAHGLDIAVQSCRVSSEPPPAAAEPDEAAGPAEGRDAG